MDYEKKYNEALEQAKGYMDAGSSDLTDVLPEIFPELRESEDERIRKEIISLVLKVMGQEKDNLSDDKYDAMLSWLEKQKEQKPIMGNGISEQTKMNETVYKFTPEEWKKALDEQLPKEQKPVEWEDIKDKVNVPYCSSEPEWSKEDERMLKRAIHIIVEYSDIDEKESEIVQNWLKSLRPSWKPSKTQIMALEQWLKNHRFDGTARYIYPIFESLFNELKTL